MSGMSKLVSIAAALLMTFLFGTSAFAQGQASDIDYGEQELYDAVPDDAAEILDKNGVTPETGGAGLSFEGALKFVWDMIKDNAVKPLRLLIALLGVVLLCALANSLCDSGDGNLKSVFSALGVLAGAGITVSSVSEILDESLSLLSTAAAFMLVFIPTFTGIAAVLGHAASATAVNAATLAATQLFSQLAVNFLAPLSGAIMGLSVTGAIHPQLDLSKLAELVKKFVVWGLTLIMTVFMSILSAQTFVANASDTALIRTAKFMVSSGVPIVGGTISDAVNTVQGGLVMLKSSVGTYGLIAGAVIMLPTLITVGCYRLALTCAETAGEIFGLKELSALFKSCCSVMTIIFAVLICFLLLNVIAVIIMLSFTSSSG